MNSLKNTLTSLNNLILSTRIGKALHIRQSVMRTILECHMWDHFQAERIGMGWFKLVFAIPEYPDIVVKGSFPWTVSHDMTLYTRVPPKQRLELFVPIRWGSGCFYIQDRITKVRYPSDAELAPLLVLGNRYRIGGIYQKNVGRLRDGRLRLFDYHDASLGDTDVKSLRRWVQDNGYGQY